VILTGTLVEVVPEVQGSSLTADVAAAGTVLPVADISDFPDAGSVQVGAVTYAYTLDEAAGTLVLGAGLSALAEEGDRVALLNAQGEVEQVVYALVDIEGDDGSDPVSAVIRTAEQPFFPLGTQEAGSVVEVESIPEGYVVLSRTRDPAVLDGSYLDTDTAPVGQTFSEDAPTSTEGYAEGHAWWQVVDGEVLGFWALVEGAWTTADIVTADALTAKNAFLEVLSTLDFTVIRNFIAEGQSTFNDPVTANDTVTASAGVGTPTVAASLENSYPALTPGTSLPQVYGLTDSTDGTEWLTASGTAGPDGIGVYGINKTTGVVTQRLAVTDVTGLYGVTRIGSEYFVWDKHWDGATVSRIRRYSSAWALSSVVTTAGDALYGWAALGNNGTDLVWLAGAGTDTVHRFTTTGTLVSSRTLFSAMASPHAVIETAADLGATRIIVGGDSGNINAHSITDGSRISADGWYVGGIGSPYGLHWDGTRFWAITSGGTVHQYSTSTSTATITATHAVTDGTEVTAASTVASTALVRVPRAFVKVTLPPPPTTPTGLYGRVYVGTSATRYQQTVTPAFSASNRVGYIDTHVLSGTTAPTVKSGTFTGEVSGDIRSEQATSGVNAWKLEGTGAWKLGPLAGTETAITADTWHTVGAVGEPAFNSTYTAQSEAVQFTKDPMGNVWMRGRCNRGGAATGTTVFTLPAGYRPSVNVDGVPIFGLGGVLGNALINTAGEVKFYFTTAANWFGLPTGFRP
jgi:hypothetical protein